MTNLQILAHNLLQCTIGEVDNTPVIQLATLADIGQLPLFNTFLAKFWQLINHGNLQQTPADLLANLAPEWRTVKSVLAHLAYSPHPHAAGAFAESLFQPNIWLGQSYYRIRRFRNSDIPVTSDITAAICYVAFLEAQAVSTALSISLENLSGGLTVLNPEVLGREAADGSHERY